MRWSRPALRFDLLVRAALGARCKGGAQGRMALYDHLPGLLQNTWVQRAAYAIGQRHVVSRIARHEAVQKPQALLGEAQGPTRPGGLTQADDPGTGRTPGQGGLHGPGQLRHGRAFKHAAQRQFRLAALPDSGDDLGGQQ